jgi:hypothetical protein
VWKARPPGFEKDHWFVIMSGQERCDETRQLFVNALACWTLRGEPRKTEVRLNGADGFALPTVCQCDFLYSVPKGELHSSLGPISWERQQQVKSKVREILRL